MSTDGGERARDPDDNANVLFHKTLNEAAEFILEASYGIGRFRLKRSVAWPQRRLDTYAHIK